MLQPFSSVLFRAPVQSLQKAYQFFSEASPLFDQGIYLSSPELWQQWQKMDELTEKEKNKLKNTLHKYWLRSCTRCTPYASFAGVFITDISANETALLLNNARNHIEYSRLDMNYVNELATTLSAQLFIKNKIEFTVNNSLYELPESFRYAEYFIKNNARNYVLAEIEKTEYLITVLNIAANGCTLQKLIDALTRLEDVSDEDAQEFLDDLIASQVLISSLEPNITGNNSLEKLIADVSKIDNTENITEVLKTVDKALRKTQHSLNDYKEIEGHLNELPFKIDVSKNIIQTDLLLSAKQHTINKDLIETIVAQVNDLKYLSRQNKNKDIEIFKQRFEQKYESEEIDLVLALDADFGIGYAGVNADLIGETELTEDLEIKKQSAENTFIDDYISRFTLLKYNDWLKHKKECITISESELKLFQNEIADFKFASSMYIFGSLFMQNEKLDKDNFQFDLSAFTGPSAPNLMGRFTHADETILNVVKEILAEEEKNFPDAIYAEIVHLPEARIGNVLLRPVLRNFEIPYAGNSGAKKENRILISDILVSVKNNKVVLRSKKYNREIIPRLTSAHNYNYKSLPVYKFLCDLQMQHIAQPNIWDWNLLKALKYLPRVVYKNIILKKAQWKINKEDINKLLQSTNDRTLFCSEVKKQFNLPDRVVIAEGDNDLLIDFSETAAHELFHQHCRRNDNIIIEEFLFTQENCILKDERNAAYTNEIIIPLYETASPTKDFIAQKDINHKNVQRKFSPNSEWLYFKIYCGPKTAEKILSNQINVFINDGLSKGLFEKFFFIRFKDDFSHIRIRFYNTDVAKQQNLQHQFLNYLQPLLNNNSINKISIDTYNRELERYNAVLIEDAETIFFNDSFAVLSLLNLFADDEEMRLYSALSGIDFLLNDFGLIIHSKHKILKTIQQSFFKEFGGLPNLQKQLNAKYRQHQKQIFLYLDEKSNTDSAIINETREIFGKRSIQNRFISQSMQTKMHAENPESFYDLIPHLLHMFINRMFINNQRKHELVIYHFMEKYYNSQLSIAGKKPL